MKELAAITLLLLAPASCDTSSDRPVRQPDARDERAAADDIPHAMPEGHPVSMPRDGIHGGGPAQAAPSDAVHGGMGAAHADGETPLEWQAPEGWRSVPPSSALRKAEWALPKVDGDPEDASLVAFHFGADQGGDVQSNLDRWYGQFEQPDGRPSGQVAQTENRTVAGMRVTVADVTGTFRGGMPGGPPGAAQQDYRLLGAIVETPSGSWFFKLTGPKRTVEHWRASFDQFIGSMRAPSAPQ